jgi:glycosyltransferase involved in cell wall biosynthesis
MKIGIFHNLPSGGAKRALYEHARGLKGLGHRLDLYGIGTAGEVFLPLKPFVTKMFHVPFDETTRIRGPVGRILRFRRAVKCHEEIAAAINKEGYDLAYLHSCIVTGAPYVGRLLRMPTVYYCQEPLFHIGPVRARLRYEGGAKIHFTHEIWNRLKQRQERATVDAITRILVNSYHSHEFAMQVWGINASVCYLGVDHSQFLPNETTREDFVLSVGALVPHKGFVFLVRSLALLPVERRPELVLVCNSEIAGQRALVEAEAKRLGVRLRIVIGVGENELVSWYRRTQMFVYASYLEPFGLAPIEAMACGTPVIAVREGGVRETVIDGKTGLLVDRDEAAFARAVERLRYDRAERDRLGSAGPSYVAQNWNWDESVRNLLWQFEQVIASKREQDRPRP